MNNQPTADFIQTWANIMIGTVKGAKSEVPTSEEAGTDFWSKVNRDCLELIKQDPDMAFKLALSLVTLRVSKSERNHPDIKQIPQWSYLYLTGVGLSMLSSDALIPRLEQMLNSTEPSDLKATELIINVFSAFVTVTASLGWDKEQAFSTPEFYSRNVVLLIFKKLETYTIPGMMGNIQKFGLLWLKIPEVREQIGWYLEIPDTEDLAKELLADEG